MPLGDLFDRSGDTLSLKAHSKRSATSTARQVRLRAMPRNRRRTTSRDSPVRGWRQDARAASTPPTAHRIAPRPRMHCASRRGSAAARALQPRSGDALPRAGLSHLAARRSPANARWKPVVAVPCASDAVPLPTPVVIASRRAEVGVYGAPGRTRTSTPFRHSILSRGASTSDSTTGAFRRPWNSRPRRRIKEHFQAKWTPFAVRKCDK